MDREKELRLLAKAGHFAASALLILIAASEGCGCSANPLKGGRTGGRRGGGVGEVRGVSEWDKCAVTAMLVALGGAALDGYELAAHGKGEGGLGVVGWAFLLGAVCWGRGGSRRAAVAAWCGVELACGVPLLVSHPWVWKEGPESRVAAMVCRALVLMLSFGLQKGGLRGGASGGGIEEAPEGEGAEELSRENLHEESNPVSQLFLAWLRPLVSAASLRPLCLRDASCVPPDAEPSVLWGEFQPLWEAGMRRGDGGVWAALRGMLGGSLGILWGFRVLCAVLEVCPVPLLGVVLGGGGRSAGRRGRGAAWRSGP